MAVLHRALFTWFVVLLFLILLVLRLDGKAEWNWFIIFIPLWLFDGVLLVYITFNMLMHCKNGYDRNDMTMLRKVGFLAAAIFKMTFEILVCVRFQYRYTLSLYVVAAPAWALLLMAIGEASRSLLGQTLSQ